jgi:hypothetical protein
MQLHRLLIHRRTDGRRDFTWNRSSGVIRYRLTPLKPYASSFPPAGQPS